MVSNEFQVKGREAVLEFTSIRLQNSDKDSMLLSMLHSGEGPSFHIRNTTSESRDTFYGEPRSGAADTPVLGCF